MRATLSVLLGATIAAALAAPLHAQTNTGMGVGDGGSPHVKSVWTIGISHVSISYGRPFLKGRAEATMMPAGKVWRSGADQATVLTTDRPITFGTVTLPAGSYTINTVPGATSWQLVIGKLAKPGQWGIPYQQSLEIGRALMTLTSARTPIEELTYFIDPRVHGGMLRLEWGTTSAQIPFTLGT